MHAMLRARTLIWALGLIVASASIDAADANPRGPAVQFRTANVVLDGRIIRTWLTLFDARRVSVMVIDNASGDNPRFGTLKSAMQATGCVAGCNGNFFNRHPFAPVGLMISEGRQITPIEPTSWMKGVLVVRGTGVTLEQSDEFHPNSEITAALQSGPWLVRAGLPEPGLDAKLRARRTFVCHDGDGIWALGACDTCTLDELSRILRHAEVATVLEIKVALNLDGGPSTGLWAPNSPGNFYLPEGWPVRNYIGLKPL